MKVFNLSTVSIAVRVSLATVLGASASNVYAEVETVQQLPTITVQAEQDNKTYTEKINCICDQIKFGFKRYTAKCHIFYKTTNGRPTPDQCK